MYGGKGSIAATANVVPELVVQVYEAYIKGDLEKARKAQYRLAPLRRAFGLGSFPVVIKDALNLIGIDVGLAREPIKSLPEAKKEELKRVLQQLNLL